jgi:NADPH2:quinone reductase
MRAIRVHEFGPADVLRLEQLPDPVPADGQLLVRVGAAGVNPVETYLRAGIAAGPPTPYTPGSDAAGVVASVGAGVAATAVGQRVYVIGTSTGAYAELALCRSDEVFPLPASLSMAQGAAIGVPYGTAHRALFQRGRGAAGETVLVHGASGGVGLAAVQLAAAAGIIVIGSASTDDGRRLLLAQGAAHAVDHSSSAHGEEVLKLTGGRGVDLVVEMRSDVNLGADLALLAARGRVVCVGNRGPGNQGQVGVNARDLMRREGDVLGVMLPNAEHDDMAAVHDGLARGFARGELRPVIAREYRLEDAAQAHRDIEEGHSLGKLVLVP